APVPHWLTTDQRLCRRNAHTMGDISTCPATSPPSLQATVEPRITRWTMRGRHRIPPLATADMKRATWIGVTRIAPWPIDLLTVSPAGQPGPRRPRGRRG